MTKTTTLTVYQKLDNPWEAAKEIGRDIALSRMFGCDNESQGRVLAMTAICEGRSLTELARRHHIIGGQLSLKADSMLSDFLDMGGKHKIVATTPEHAEIELTLGDQVHSESFTWEEAQQEEFVYEKDGKTLKKNWRTPRARKQSLWARVVSEAVRRLAPQVNCGVYTPEESADFVQVEVVEKPTPTAAELLQQQAQQAQAAKPAGDVPKRTASGTQKPQPSQHPQQTTPSQQQQSTPGTIGSLDDDGEIVDAEFEVKDDQVDQPSPAANAPCTEHQRQLIEQAFESLEMTGEQREKAIQKRGGQVLRNLTVAAAEDLLQALTDAMGKRVVGDSKVPPEHEQAAHRMHEATPCPQEYADQIKRRLGDLSDPEFMTRLKKHLAVYGKSKLTELTYGDAQRLMVALEQEVAGDWLSHPLVRLDEEGNVVEPGRQ